MNKAELHMIFDKFARTAIKSNDDGYYLHGNNVGVQLIGDIWDVYISNQKEYVKGNRTAYLGTGKINNICATLPENINVRKLDGEAYFQTSDLTWLKGWLDTNRTALGIKKRKSPPPVQFGVKVA